MRLFFVFFAVLAGSASAAPGTFRLGPIGGANFADLSNQNAFATADTKRRTGFAAGLSADYQFDGNLYFQTEAVYTQHGLDYGSFGVPAYVHFEAIKVPLLLKVLIPVAPSFRLGFLAGPSLEVTVGGKNKSDLGVVSDLTELQTLLANLEVGVAAELALTPTVAATLDGRYCYGLNGAIKGTNMFGENRDLALLAGIKFAL